MNVQYKSDLKVGKIYQDFTAEILHRRYGISLMTYCSQKYQQERGENVMGVEVKKDQNCSRTTNVFIETYERSDKFKS